MTRPAVLLLILSTLLAMLTMPAVAVSESTTEPAAISSSDSAVVQATFFFSPDCGHCEHVITQTLPGIFADNGGQPVVTYDQDLSADQVAFYLMSNGQLQMLMVDVSTEDGSAMFQADSVRLGVDRAGVPRLDLLEDTYLVGSGDIPEQFPGIVEEGLAGDGIAWPAVPGIDAALAPFIEDGSIAGLQAEVPPESTEEPVAAIEPTAEATVEPEFEPGAVVLPVGGDDDDVLDKVGKDPVGNGLAIIVLIALVLSAIGAPLLAARGSLPTFPSWLVIVLVIAGVGVSAYLANVETSGDAAVCGPVGDCNAVQESEYAQLLGVPIGVLGIIGYLFIGGLWIVSRAGKGSVADWALALVALIAFGGTLFSIYLTFLEPFVIGASCMWCITSALVMMALLWTTAGPGWSAFDRLRRAQLR